MANIEKLQHLLARGTGHKNMDDVIFKKIDDSLRIYNRVGLFDIFDKSQKELYMSDTSDTFLCNVDGCSSTYSSMADYDLHYNSNHRYTCTYCRKLLQSAHLLDLHISELHDNFFKASSAKKPMFKCFIETCETLFWNSEERDTHCKDIHKITKNFLQHYGIKKNKKKKKKTKNDEPPNLEAMISSSMVID